MEKMRQSDDNHIIPMTSIKSGKGEEATSGLYYFTNQIVNVVFIGEPGKGDWFLVDAGMPLSAAEIISKAEDRFGKDNPPRAILLTHGHFDHIGSIVKLIEKWDCPVYAHLLEFPYLSGARDYPEPDVTVEGGMLAKISMLYPHEATNIAPVLHQLPADGSVPGLPEWRWIHTPGHTPGHVSFFRERGRALIAGDAFVTVRTDYFYKVLIQEKEVNGPPRYLTTNWDDARRSVETLAALNPEVVITGHGSCMSGEPLREGLQKLVAEFDTVALPSHGKYVHTGPDKNENS